MFWRKVPDIYATSEHSDAGAAMSKQITEGRKRPANQFTTLAPRWSRALIGP